jgi:hypothetical protein
VQVLQLHLTEDLDLLQVQVLQMPQQAQWLLQGHPLERP